jgi:2-keto-4-pentenoate hydratase/2-oxohepta-3-ene-1,7-dioic acid hydratase in catechol pathway
MRLATILEDGRPVVAIVEGERVRPINDESTMRIWAEGGFAGFDRVRRWVDEQPDDRWSPLFDVALGPAVADPGAIYTIGLNYRTLDDDEDAAPPRPLVYSKLPSSVAGHGATLSWDRAVTANVDAECELGVVVGADGGVFGYTIVNDVSSRDPWLDGDQWLLGKSMPGFCPVGPWIVTADELDPADLRLGCTINGEPIQDGRTSDMRFSIPDVMAYLSRHVRFEPGDLIATGTPARLPTPPGPERHLESGDVVTAWIEGIGELTTTIA